MATRAERLIRRAIRRRGFAPAWLGLMAEVDLDFLEAYERIYELTAVRTRHLPARFRELVVVAAVAIRGYGPGLKDHIRRALRLGATREEIVEVLQSAYFHTGALTLVHGMLALAEVLAERTAGAARPVRAVRGAARGAPARGAP